VPTRYDSLIEDLREAARPDRDAPAAMAGYLEKVRLHAYRVTDREVQELQEAGYPDDEIFEHTVATAVSAGLERLEAGLRALE
jgi:alkylhydroperoxidase family enzyme